MPAAYPEEFRRRAVDLVRASNESLSAVARRLGISVFRFATVGFPG